VIVAVVVAVVVVAVIVVVVVVLYMRRSRHRLCKQQALSSSIMLSVWFSIFIGFCHRSFLSRELHKKLLLNLHELRLYFLHRPFLVRNSAPVLSVIKNQQQWQQQQHFVERRDCVFRSCVFDGAAFSTPEYSVPPTNTPCP